MPFFHRDVEFSFLVNDGFGLRLLVLLEELLDADAIEVVVLEVDVDFLAVAAENFRVCLVGSSTHVDRLGV